MSYTKADFLSRRADIVARRFGISAETAREVVKTVVAVQPTEQEVLDILDMARPLSASGVSKGDILHNARCTVAMLASTGTSIDKRVVGVGIYKTLAGEKAVVTREVSGKLFFGYYEKLGSKGYVAKVRCMFAIDGMNMTYTRVRIHDLDLSVDRSDHG